MKRTAGATIFWILGIFLLMASLLWLHRSGWHRDSIHIRGGIGHYAVVSEHREIRIQKEKGGSTTEFEFEFHSSPKESWEPIFQWPAYQFQPPIYVAISVWTVPALILFAGFARGIFLILRTLQKRRSQGASKEEG